MPILLLTTTTLRGAGYVASERSRAGAFFRRIGVDQPYSRAPGMYGGVGSGNAFRSAMCDILLTSKAKLDKAAGRTRRPSTWISSRAHLEIARRTRMETAWLKPRKYTCFLSVQVVHQT